MTIKTKLTNPKAKLPDRAHPADAGADLFTPVDVSIPAHSDTYIDTGVAVQIPEGYYGKIESKSGLGIKHGITAFGGVIDSGYTGSIVVKLTNQSYATYHFNEGDKIAQLIIQPCLACSFEKTETLKETERGDNGFGSTGK